MLGHINGNALYNLKDPAFKEFVSYTMQRFPPHLMGNSYDVALWKVIADYPYSWPMWQRYASKFQHTDLIMNLGVMDAKDLAKQRSGEGAEGSSSEGPMFIHGRINNGLGFGRSSESKQEQDAACAALVSEDPDVKYVTDASCAAGEGLRWIAHGFSALGLSDRELLEREFIVYDALYAECQRRIGKR